MKKRIQKKIEHLREQPEHVRLRFASIIMLVGGGVFVALWLLILLPLQLYFQRPNIEEGEVSGARDVQETASPTPTAIPTN